MSTNDLQRPWHRRIVSGALVAVVAGSLAGTPSSVDAASQVSNRVSVVQMTTVAAVDPCYQYEKEYLAAAKRAAKQAMLAWYRLYGNLTDFIKPGGAPRGGPGPVGAPPNC
jgi:hypothetical protein